MILKMRLGTMGGTDAFITTATMAVVTNWVHWVTALPETLGSWDFRLFPAQGTTKHVRVSME